MDIMEGVESFILVAFPRAEARVTADITAAGVGIIIVPGTLVTASAPDQTHLSSPAHLSISIVGVARGFFVRN